METTEQIFCKNVAYIRRCEKLTQKQMGEILGVSAATVRKMERGASLPRIYGKMVYRVCMAFRISADAILTTDLAEQQVCHA